MRLIVDTSVIISALIKDSLARRILLQLEAELLTIHFSAREIENHKREIIEVAGISNAEFDHILEKLMNFLITLDDQVVRERMVEAHKIMDHIDSFDTPCISAALAVNADIWSNDKHFEKQNKIKVWKTKDLEPFL